ncbi:hypothetical protein [Nonomuraea antimicrobica]|uniref:hypothetical protein n=1 Tax=Nonomuraea antimicrobica TaxID=561173 RepID=UPI0031EAB334
MRIPFIAVQACAGNGVVRRLQRELFRGAMWMESDDVTGVGKDWRQSTATPAVVEMVASR